MQLHWDWNVNAGNVLTGLGLLAGFIVAHIQNIKKMEQIITKVDMMFRWFTHNVIDRRDDE